VIDSMNVRDYGFKEIFNKFDNNLVDRLLDYHRQNGGLSRYVKIRYFYNDLLGQEISEQEVKEYADKFSEVMKIELVKKDYLIQNTLEFIKNNSKKYNLHIVSGSDELELVFLCKELEISCYFKSIHGSPTSKEKLVRGVLQHNNYVESETILIGDSINDYDAAKANSINFYGFNNIALVGLSEQYLENYKEL